MARIFVDTSAWYAIGHPEDQNHRRAVNVWEALQRDKIEVLTSDWVFAETISLATNRVGIRLARLMGDNILASPSLTILCIHPEMLSLIWGVFCSVSSHVSLVDSSSFFLMRQHRMSTAFTYDRHFADQGFEALT